ncbi:hypothetical protein LEP1GSC047_0167 [Leptospira inadai serovar Lyme str. 10]|uniref:Yip1 domain protein n=2 Tax=Leptospira inadai serovar Lyme TaxID=293084 RepID=V6HF79_9LEPT|nr:hypothetical protein [Leptospira inadai]EQA38927.1 hypothetical protein LEP1GSC047_0167 [Leptospira inadai serovar Lyme str. 10]PNV72135.1 hypothetical protein BES34_020125 [Leptospira inadai serovar Lyme]
MFKNLREIGERNGKDIVVLLKNKIEIQRWEDPAVRRSLIRYGVLLGFAFLLTVVYTTVLFLTGAISNSTADSLYANQEISYLLYFLIHFPQSTVSFLLFWILIPLVIGVFWAGFLYVLNGTDKQISLPTLLVLTLNCFLFPLTTISILGLIGAVKNLLVAGFLMKLLFVIQGIFFLAGYFGALLYAIKSFQKQFDQPLGRAVVQAIGPTILFFILYSIF